MEQEDGRDFPARASPIPGPSAPGQASSLHGEDTPPGLPSPIRQTRLSHGISWIYLARCSRRPIPSCMFLSGEFPAALQVLWKLWAVASNGTSLHSIYSFASHFCLTALLQKFKQPRFTTKLHFPHPQISSSFLRSPVSIHVIIHFSPPFAALLPPPHPPFGGMTCSTMGTSQEEGSGWSHQGRT